MSEKISNSIILIFQPICLDRMILFLALRFQKADIIFEFIIIIMAISLCFTQRKILDMHLQL